MHDYVPGVVLAGLKNDDDDDDLKIVEIGIST